MKGFGAGLDPFRGHLELIPFQKPHFSAMPRSKIHKSIVNNVDSYESFISPRGNNCSGRWSALGHSFFSLPSYVVNSL
jgi:hypothetical protein